MKILPFAACLLLLASTASLAQRCPTIETSLMDKGFAEYAPWRVTSGGPGQCSFSTRNTSVNFGFSHVVSPTLDAATAGALDMKRAVAATSLVEPMPSLGEEGFTYQQRKPNGEVDRSQMFFYGHRGTIGLTGYLNLTGPITPEQRLLAGNLLSATLGAASNPKKLAKESNCRYLDASLVKQLLPSGDPSIIVPDANNCVLSADGKAITVSVSKDSRGWAAAERLLKEGGCTVETIPGVGKGAGIAHHCTKGNPRAEAIVVTGSRMVKVLFAPPAEPSAAERATLVELARYAARN
ncbi:MAG: hypothetical protein U1F54_13430 [Burkholderiales bacterium]